jgi:hypothetical protein
MTASNKIHVRLKEELVDRRVIEEGAQAGSKPLGLKIRIRLKPPVEMPPPKANNGAGTSTKKTRPNRVLSDPDNCVPDDAPRGLIDMLCKIARSKNKIVPSDDRKPEPAVPEPGESLLGGKKKLRNIKDVVIPPFQYSAGSQLALLKSHYLSISKIVQLSLKFYKENAIELPFRVGSIERGDDDCVGGDGPVVYEFWNEERGAYVEVDNLDLIVEDIVLAAWRYVIEIYDRLVEKEDVYESFVEKHTPYTIDRITEFVAEYKRFVRTGESEHYNDFKEQVYDHIKNLGLVQL